MGTVQRHRIMPDHLKKVEWNPRDETVNMYFLNIWWRFTATMSGIEKQIQRNDILINGSHIKFHRQDQNITQTQLAKGICSVPYLSKIENEIATPSEEVFGLLAKRLNLDVSLLMSDISEQVLLEKLSLWNTSMIMRKDEEAVFGNRELVLTQFWG